MAKKKAEVKVEDVIVSVACPECGERLVSPGFPQSLGWDRKDVKKVGAGGRLNCPKCRNRFELPAKLFTLVEGGL